ncbi:MAG: Ig-like domain-containing protein [Gemmatimonadaceae bacterium]
MRKGLIYLTAFLAACASASPPPGGPEDKEPPQLLKVTPDTNAVNVHDKYVTFQFDETINDRGTGAQDLQNFFLVSPTDGATRVEWHRSRVDVAPKRGFRNGVSYTVTLLPGLNDLRGNPMKKGAKVVFSTGAVIPPYRVAGIVFDWLTERPAANAYIEAVAPDSIVYLAQADSSGHFEIGPLNQGTYVVRGIMDANNNRSLDRNEAFDSIRVNVPVPAPIELLAAPRDTFPVRLSTVTVSDSVTLRVVFDHALDPAQPVGPEAFRLVAFDSSIVPIANVLNPRQERSADSVARKVSADSTRRADSVAGKPLPPITPTPAAPAPVANGRPAAAPPPVPSRPSPFNSVTIKLAKPLAHASEYRLSAHGLRSLTGRTQESERRFTTPKAPPPKPAATDSTTKQPPAPARPPR